MTQTADDVAAELALTIEEGLALTAFQYRMLQRDIAAEASDKRRAKKRPVRDKFRSAVVSSLEELVGRRADVEALQPWAQEFLATFAAESFSGRRLLMEDAHLKFGPDLTRRSRALLLLIDLYGFEPWVEARWVEKTRKETLRELVDVIPSLRAEDLDSVASEYQAVLQALKRKSFRWGRLLLIGGGGLALGALTLGLAAPIIGAAVGSMVFGLSGAAATSAGLAALGGGAVAAGGFGMAGGTALLVGVGGVAGVGTAAAGGNWTGWTAGQVVADAIKLEVVTKLILLDAEGDDEKARIVVMGLQERIRGLAAQVVQAAEAIKAQREQIGDLQRVNAAQKKKQEVSERELAAKGEEIARLKEEAKQAMEHLDELELAQSALELVADRIEAAL